MVELHKVLLIHNILFGQALEQLQAERIVCGYKVIEDEELYKDCLNNKIHFETSATTSLIRGTVPLNNFYHPVVQFAEDGMNFR